MSNWKLSRIEGNDGFLHSSLPDKAGDYWIADGDYVFKAHYDPDAYWGIYEWADGKIRCISVDDYNFDVKWYCELKIPELPKEDDPKGETMIKKVTVEFEDTIEDTIFEMSTIFEFQMDHGLENQLGFSCKGLGEWKQKEKNMFWKDEFEDETNKLFEGLMYGIFPKGEENMKETVHVEDYVIASRDKETKKYWSITTVSPHVYKTYQVAIANADTLAQLDSTKEFIVLAVAAVVSAATVNRTYKL